MIYDYRPLKIMLGSDNDDPVEDPVRGSNGTMCVMKINALIDRLQDDMGGVVPQGKGNLIVGGATEPMELQVGPNNYCLTVDSTSASGLVWEERVDMSTNQRVGGRKTFTSDVEALQGLVVGLDLGVGGNASIAGNLSASRGHLTGTLEVGGSALLQSTLTVENNANLRSNLSVAGASALTTAVLSSTLNVGGAVHMDADLTVVGVTSLQSGLSVGGSATVAGSISVGNDIMVADSLSVGGTSNLTSLAVTGPTALNTATATDLTVTGTANLVSLSLAGALAVGTTLTAGGSITSGGDITATRALTVGGLSTLAAVTATNITASGTATTGKLVALGDSTLNGNLWVGGGAELRSTLMVISGTTLKGDLSVAGLSKLDRTTTAGLTATGPVYVNNTLSVGGATQLGSDLLIEGSAFVEGGGTVEGDLAVGGRTMLAGSLQGPTATFDTVTSTTGTITTLTTDTIRAKDIQYTGALTGSAATLNTLSTQSAQATTLQSTTLTVTGSAVIPGLSGTNTGDEVEATPTVSGTVRVTSPTDPIVYTVTDAQTAFIAKSEKGTTLATLENGKIPASQLPPVAITETYVVATIAEMNALAAQVGDVAIMSDPPSTYILQSEPNGWLPMSAPTDTVQSVFNRVGNVQAQAGDYTAAMVSLSPIPNLNATDVQVAVEKVVGALKAHVTDTNTNPHKVTAEQVGAIALMEKGEGGGVATLDNTGKVPPAQLPDGLLLSTTSKKVVEFTAADLVSGVLEVEHGLGDKYPSSVMVYSNLDRVVVPDDIEAVGSNTLKVYLTSFNSMSGTWRVAVSL